MSDDDRPCHCDECEEIAALRVQLAAVEAENRTLVEKLLATSGSRHVREVERDAANERVKALEAALEPKAAKMAVSDEQWKRCTHLDDGPMQRGTVCWACAITAIRARAGLTKEGR